MAIPQHLDVLKQGVRVWNEWREENPGAEPDLAGAKLSKANLKGANLIEANLSKSELNRSNLSGAFVAWSCFGDNDLSYTKGLEKVKHFGPSTIGIDTIYRSEGKIPQEFLRGTGVPEHFIVYAGYLNARAFEGNSCFISYSGKDRNFVEKLNANLQKEGVRCWFAPEEMKMGDESRQRVNRQIRIHEKLLIVLSEFSIESAWIQQEVEAALEEEHNRNGSVLFPIRLDDSCLDGEKEWLVNLQKTHQIYDFSTWDTWEAYHEQFILLLHDLEANAPGDLDNSGLITQEDVDTPAVKLYP